MDAYRSKARDSTVERTISDPHKTGPILSPAFNSTPAVDNLFEVPRAGSNESGVVPSLGKIRALLEHQEG